MILSPSYTHDLAPSRSDDGSTAIEVALKMAFRKFSRDRGMDDGGAVGRPVELQV